MNRRMDRCAAAAFAAVALAIAGCAATADEWHLYGEGWRTGYVVALGDADHLGSPLEDDCRLASGPRRGAGGGRFARVLYAARPGLLRQRVVPVDAASPVVNDSWVLVNVERCDASPVPHAPPAHSG